MRGLLDNDYLNGPHEVHVTFRPARTAVPIPAGDVSFALRAIRNECQLWGGASSPLIPLLGDGSLNQMYESAIRGSAVDGIRGLGRRKMDELSGARPTPAQHTDWHGGQLATALLRYRRPDSYSPLEITTLQDEDPWQPIYAACLGHLPDFPDPALLDASNLKADLTFEDFLSVERVQATGSLEDLLGRLSNRSRFTPRRLSMVHLEYGNPGSSYIRTGPVLPEPRFVRDDAGPNVIVVCSPGSVDDLALLWNLRAASGDARVVPIGIPESELSPEIIDTVLRHPLIGRNGMAHRQLYVTSASVEPVTLADELSSLLESARPAIAVAPARDVLTFGEPGGWHRAEVMVFDEGRIQLPPLPRDSHTEIVDGGGMNDRAHMTFDVAVPASPFPSGYDVRLSTTMGTYRAGCRTADHVSPDYSSQLTEVNWPSTLLMARAIAARRGLLLTESEPGRACRLLVEGMRDIAHVHYLAHRPLLQLLESMAARQGFPWYKERLRRHGVDAEPSSAVSPSGDDLPHRPYGHFKRALGNSDRATRYWLLWAETKGLIIKGFPLQCSRCLGRQWIPVGAFSPPLFCRGCGEMIDTPFGDRMSINFEYRISERLRRVYEQDAMGHLLVANFLHSILESGKFGRLIGLHPGLDVHLESDDSSLGEADVLLMTRGAEMVPVEVKRRGVGLTATELAKLDVLGENFKSPWSAVAICEYLGEAAPETASLGTRHTDQTHKRILLTYEHLLEPHPHWGMGDDPFTQEPMTTEEISKREAAFVNSLGGQWREADDAWIEVSLMYSATRPRANESPSSKAPPGG